MPLITEPPFPETPNCSSNKKACFGQEVKKYIWGKDNKSFLMGGKSFPKRWDQAHETILLGLQMGKTELEAFLECCFCVPRGTAMAQAVCKQCLTCVQNEDKGSPSPLAPGKQELPKVRSRRGLH